VNHFRIAESTKWLAVVTGVLMAVLSVVIGWSLFAIFPLLMMIGGLWPQRRARGALALLCFSSISISLVFVPFGLDALARGPREARILLVAFATISLIGLADIAIWQEYLRYRRNR
jgi:hypothetical protein